MNVGIYNTFINKAEFFRIFNPVIDSTMLSEGALVKEFETRLSEKLGIINPIALNSGTSALHLALVLAGIGEGDEVICPAQTFVATSLVIKQEKAVPVFADIQYRTGNIDPASVEKLITPKTKAIMAVHWGGYPCDMDELVAIAKKHNLILIEDAAHAPGAEYKGKKIGSISDYTCFSFQAIKHITTGDGGAIAVRDEKNVNEAMKRRWFGIDRKNALPDILGERKYDITDVGYKYHMNDYSAALGLANLIGFEERLNHRRGIASLYRNKLSGVAGLELFESREDRKGSYWLFGMHVEKREDFIRALKDKGITASVIHRGIDKNTIFGGVQKELVHQRKFDQTQIHIPLHDAVTVEVAEYICDSIKAGW